MHSIAHSLNRVANVTEAWWAREREKPQVDPASLGAKALWMQDVAAGDCLIGFTEWLARYDTTPEEIEALAPAIQAVRRGFADMETQLKGERNDLE